MTTLAAARVRAVAPDVAARWVAVALVTGVVLLLRIRQLHPAPLYPDGYQYLAMSRDIVQTGRPVGALGPGGDVFVPSADAAAKPLFPTLVALFSLSGMSLAGAARFVSALAGTALVMLVAAATHRLTSSRLAGLAAGVCCVASPALGYWTGFVGPDALALALGLGAALALLARRPALGGVLCGLACATRPELMLLAVAAAFAAVTWRDLRPATLRAATSAALMLSVVLGAVRPPLVLPSPAVLGAAVVLALAAGGLFSFAARAPRSSAASAVGIALALPAILAVKAGGSPGALEMARSDWPLLIAGLAGVAAGLARARLRVATCGVSVAVALLAATYVTKNATSARYMALLLPLAFVLVGLGVGALHGRARWFGVAPGLAAAASALVLAGPPTVGGDMFPGLAADLRALPPRPLVTAAPDAYGVLLPDRAVRAMRPGAIGLVLMDAAQRAYEPGVRVRGRVVARLPNPVGFRRPDGDLDRSPAVVVDGVVGSSP